MKNLLSKNLRNIKEKQSGFTLLELLVTIFIISLISTVMLTTVVGAARAKARDLKRKTDLAQIGGMLSFSCLVPSGGDGTYDLLELTDEISAKAPEAGLAFTQIPRDPQAGTDTESFYRYVVEENGQKCALYANLENDRERTTLLHASPTAGGGMGVLKTIDDGWNGSPKYFQVSN